MPRSEHPENLKDHLGRIYGREDRQNLQDNCHGPLFGAKRVNFNGPDWIDERYYDTFDSRFDTKSLGTPSVPFKT